MPATQPYKVKSISQLHQMRGLSKPDHPLISVVNLEPARRVPAHKPVTLVTDFYIIALKRNFNSQVKVKYGHQQYDYEEGVLNFISPGQVFSIEYDPDP